MLVVVTTRDGASEGTFAAPQGRWRDVLRGEQRTFSGRQRLGDVLGEHGIAVLERLGR